MGTALTSESLHGPRGVRDPVHAWIVYAREPEDLSDLRSAVYDPRLLRGLEERLAKFGLTLHPDKTRIIEFRGFAAATG